MSNQLTNSLNIDLDFYFEEFIKGRGLNELMPDIYNKIKFNFETDLIEQLSIDYFDNVKLIESFKTNINMWAIARNYQQAKEITDFIFVNKGNMTDKLVENFLNSNKSRYNEAYLKTETNYLNNTIENINNYETFPNDSFLVFSTANDEKVRHSHAILDGLTLPKNDSRWAYLYPPVSSSPWGCRCRVIPKYDTTQTTDKEVDKIVDDMAKDQKTTSTKIKQETHPLFSGEIFNSTDTYFKGVPEKILNKNAI